MSSNIKIQRICQHCGQEFTARTTVTQYCGDICAKRAYKARVKAGKIEASNNQTKAVREKSLEEIKAREFLTIRDAATLLSCSRQTVYNLIRNGILQAVNLSERKTLINRTAIDKLFEKVQPDIALTMPNPEKLDIKDCYSIQLY
jgi:excisionase family DNA binding protein